MEAKYYTPQISDIFIGFECELFYQDDFKLARTENLKWHKTIIDKNKFQQAFSLIKVNKIRVKHLDREDIESCGWEFVSEDNYYKKANENWGYSLYYDSKENTYSIDNTEEYEMWKQYFEGTIKNISELKKLMVQLNIK